MFGTVGAAGEGVNELESSDIPLLKRSGIRSTDNSFTPYLTARSSRNQRNYRAYRKIVMTLPRSIRSSLAL
jgi:hypothetical protein